MNIQFLITYLILFLCCIVTSAQTTISVYNPTDMQRHELITVSLDDLPDEAFVIRDSNGKEIETQEIDNNLLLIEVSVQPHQTALYHTEMATPTERPSLVNGQMYTIRKDDIAWENDLCAYRIYGPALQKSGERAFGIDVWVKNTSEPVVAARYAADFSGNLIEDSLRKAGKHEEANYINRITSFHIDHGNGMDVYGVGPSLGCGAPALIIDGKMKMPYCYTSYKITDNGPLRVSIELDYADGEHRVISLDKGSHFNEMRVWYDNIPSKSNVSLAAGIVLHDNNKPILGNSYVCYADPTEDGGHYSQIFVATLFPFNNVKTCTITDEMPHAIGIVDKYKGEPVTYYFGAAWSNYDIHTLPEWQLRAELFIKAKQNPLKVKIKKHKR